jgi:O-antigen/teichoic acid export membrane protein
LKALADQKAPHTLRHDSAILAGGKQMTLSRRTLIGIFWSFSEQVASRGIAIVITLVLATLLNPADYGLIAMMAVFLALGESLMDSGFKQGLIRLVDPTQVDFDTAFLANIGFAITAYALLFFSAPLIANFYAEPKLIELIRVAAIAILINAGRVVQSAQLSRALHFKYQLYANVPAGILSGAIAIGLAYSGLGAWALIAQMLIAAVVATAVLWRLQGWRPTWRFSNQSFLTQYGFGYRLFLSASIGTLFNNLHTIVIAKIFSASVAGNYYFASKIRDLVINQIVRAIENVSYPALASIQSDEFRLREGYRRVIVLTTFLLFPAMMMAATVARSLFEVVLPAHWMPAALYFQLMAFGSLLYPLHSINLNILMVKGRSDLFLYIEIIKRALSVFVLLISWRHGVIAIIWGQIAVSAISYLPNSYYSAVLIRYSARQQIEDVWPTLLASLVPCFLTWLILDAIDQRAWLELLLGTISYWALYLSIAIAIKARGLTLCLQIAQQEFMHQFRR